MTDNQMLMEAKNYSS